MRSQIPGKETVYAFDVLRSFWSVSQAQLVAVAVAVV